MKVLKFLTAIALSAVVLLNVMPSMINAEDSTEQTQKQDQKLKVECTTGSYGQTSTCTAEGEQHQEQTQKLVYVDMPIHNVANTGLDMFTMSAVAITLAIGATAYIAKRKIA